MSFIKKHTKLLSLFVIVTITGLTLFSFNWKAANSPYPFYKDPHTYYRLDYAIRSDRNPTSVSLLVTRILHNKPVFHLDTYFVSLFRSIDPIYLFSLPGSASMYEKHDKSELLFPWEFPFFVFSTIYFIRRWDKVKKDYFYLPLLLFLAVILTGFFLPPLNTMKLLPLLVAIRSISVLGIFSFLFTKIWQQK